GLGSGSTTFVAGNSSGGYSFQAFGSNNVADFSTATRPNLALPTVKVDMTTGSVTLQGVAADSISGITTVLGSTVGHNTFIAGTGSETFGDTGTTGGDTVNFFNVATSATAKLTVNVSGATVNGVFPYTATVGTTTYTFSNNGANFTTFVGPQGGQTTFVASGQLDGYSFTGSGQNVVADFSANVSGIVANLTSGPEDGVPAGEVSIGGGNPDAVSGITTIIGSPDGPNVFYGALKGMNFTAQS